MARRKLFIAFVVLLGLVGLGVGSNALISARAGGVRAAAPSCAPLIDFAKQSFTNPTRIENGFLRLVPGTQFTYEGRANRGGGSLPHQVVSTVTSLTKVVDGIVSTVVWEVDRNEGQLAESELAFYAQDDAGNVWNVGEYPEEYSGGQFSEASNTWIGGVGHAVPGPAMLANPLIGDFYLQGTSPDIDFLDCASVVAFEPQVCIPVKCYDNVLVTEETSPLDPEGGVQRKSYAPGVGNIKVEAVNDPEGETLVLTGVNPPNPKALSDADAAALDLDRRGYRNSDIYRQTLPARPRQ